MYAPEVSITCVMSQRGRKPSISFLPNSRFIKEFDVICPTKPAGCCEVPSPLTAKSKKRSMKGTESEYLPWHEG